MIKIAGLVFISIIVLFSARASMQGDSCAGITPQPLIVGERGQVTPGDPNTVRELPDTDGVRIGAIPAGAAFDVLEGPSCADGFAWWRVNYEGLMGWTADGSDGSAWLSPVSEAAPDTLTPNDTTGVVEWVRVGELRCETQRYTPGLDSSIAFSADGRYAAMACGPFASGDDVPASDQIGIFNLTTSAQIVTLTGEGQPVRAISFLPDNMLLWMVRTEDETGFGQKVNLHITDNTDVVVYNGTRASKFVLSEDGSTLATVGFYDIGPSLETVQTEGARNYTATPLSLPENYTIGEFAFSADLEQFAAVLIPDIDTTTDMRLVIANVASGEIVVDLALATFDTGYNGLLAGWKVIFSPSGRFILASLCVVDGNDTSGDCDVGAIVWWDAATGTEVERWTTEDFVPRSLAFDSSDDLLAAAGFGGTRIYNVDSGEVVTTIPGTDVYFAAFTRDSTELIVVDNTGVFRYAAAP